MQIQYQNAPVLLNPSTWIAGSLDAVDGGTVITNADGTVASMQPDGTFQSRPPGTHGAYELCTLDSTNNVVRYNPAGISFPVAVRGV